MLSLVINKEKISVDSHLTIQGLYETLYFIFRNVHFILYRDEERLEIHDTRTLSGSDFYKGTRLVMLPVCCAFYKVNSSNYHFGTKTKSEPIETLGLNDTLEVYWVSNDIYELCRMYPCLRGTDKPNGGISGKTVSLLLGKDALESIARMYGDMRPGTPSIDEIPSTSFETVDDDWGWGLGDARLEEDDYLE